MYSLLVKHSWQTERKAYSSWEGRVRFQIPLGAPQNLWGPIHSMTLLIGFRNFLILEQSLLEPPETSGNLWELLWEPCGRLHYQNVAHYLHTALHNLALILLYMTHADVVAVLVLLSSTDCQTGMIDNTQ